jgi:aminopeptidase N
VKLNKGDTYEGIG